MKAVERERGPARRFVLGVMLWQALPFGLALGVMRDRRPLPDALRPQTTVALSAPVAELRAVADPAGARVAVLTNDAVVHELAFHGQRPQVQAVALPLPPADTPLCNLLVGDLDVDRRSDLVVRYRRERLQLWWLRSTPHGPSRPAPAPARAAALRNRRPTWLGHRDGQVLSASYEWQGEGMSRVVNHVGRIAQMLPGVPAAMGDLDGDGSDELVTVAAEDNRQAALLRLFRFDGTRLREVWRHRQLDPVLASRYHPTGLLGLDPLLAVADLDHDGAAELLVGSGVAGRLELWRWAAR